MQPADPIRINFTAQTLDYVYRVLTRCPFSEVSEILADIQRQVQQQQTPPLPEVVGFAGVPPATE